METNTSIELKDDKLSHMITEGLANVAQFASFGPNNEDPRHVHITNNQPWETRRDLITNLLKSSQSQIVNIRSFSPTQMKGNRFIYGKNINQLDEILAEIDRNSQEGLYSIVNENIDVSDSGVSGVIIGNLIEFSPDDTPRCVEKEGVCSLPKDIGFEILRKVYGFTPDNKFGDDYRVEFSIHPRKQGVTKTHTITWEYEHVGPTSYQNQITWPNNFSRHIGDKAYGLLLADVLGIPVPRTTVMSRKVYPFTFGVPTGSHEKWMRTCPIVKEPGMFYTGRDWEDPFILMEEEEAKGSLDINIASLLSQDSVDPIYSGGSIIKKDSELIEGVDGDGDAFMVGEQTIGVLPENVIDAVKELHNKIRVHLDMLGDVSIEWVYDGDQAWLVQLNQLKVETELDGITIVPGNPDRYEKVYVMDGLESLRQKLNQIDKNTGIEIIGNIGITSHFGDLLRLSKTPSIITRQ